MSEELKLITVRTNATGTLAKFSLNVCEQIQRVNRITGERETALTCKSRRVLTQEFSGEQLTPQQCVRRLRAQLNEEKKND